MLSLHINDIVSMDSRNKSNSAKTLPSNQIVQSKHRQSKSAISLKTQTKSGNDQSTSASSSDDLSLPNMCSSHQQSSLNLSAAEKINNIIHNNLEKKKKALKQNVNDNTKPNPNNRCKSYNVTPKKLIEILKPVREVQDQDENALNEIIINHSQKECDPAKFKKSMETYTDIFNRVHWKLDLWSVKYAKHGQNNTKPFLVSP